MVEADPSVCSEHFPSALVHWDSLCCSSESFLILFYFFSISTLLWCLLAVIYYVASGKWSIQGVIGLVFHVQGRKQRLASQTAGNRAVCEFLALVYLVRESALYLRKIGVFAKINSTLFLQMCQDSRIWLCLCFIVFSVISKIDALARFWQKWAFRHIIPLKI